MPWCLFRWHALLEESLAVPELAFRVPAHRDLPKSRIFISRVVRTHLPAEAAPNISHIVEVLSGPVAAHRCRVHIAERRRVGMRKGPWTRNVRAMIELRISRRDGDVPE